MRRDRYVELTELGDIGPGTSGGQGRVHLLSSYRMDGFTSVALKLYKPVVLKGVRPSKLEFMVGAAEQLNGPDRYNLFRYCAWPLRLVRERNEVIGFLMPAVDSRFYVSFRPPSKVTRRILGELQHALNEDEWLVARGIPMSDKVRFGILRDVALGLNWLHRHDVVVGDLSAKNLLFSTTPEPAAFLLDCDSMLFQGRLAVGYLETDDWQLPKGYREANPSRFTDCYKFALVALRLLSRDACTRSIDEVASHAPKEICQLIDAGLSPARSERPSAKDWIGPLNEAVQNASTAYVKLTPSETSSRSTIFAAAPVKSTLRTTPTTPSSVTRSASHPSLTTASNTSAQTPSSPASPSVPYLASSKSTRVNPYGFLTVIVVAIILISLTWFRRAGTVETAGAANTTSGQPVAGRPIPPAPMPENSPFQPVEVPPVETTRMSIERAQLFVSPSYEASILGDLMPGDTVTVSEILTVRNPAASALTTRATNLLDGGARRSVQEGALVIVLGETGDSALVSIKQGSEDTIVRMESASLRRLPPTEEWAKIRLPGRGIAFVPVRFLSA